MRCSKKPVELGKDVMMNFDDPYELLHSLAMKRRFDSLRRKRKDLNEVFLKL